MGTERTAAGGVAGRGYLDAPLARLSTSRSAWALAAACVAVAALSLLAPHAPTYDPWAWLNWGRQIADGHLDTRAGPSWKPLPVLFTTLFAGVDEGWAPGLWLVVVRAAGLLSLVLAFRLAQRLAGSAVAGALAVVALVLENGYVAGFARGNSEAILVALGLWAILRHLDGRPRHALALLLAAGLLRPEVWPFAGLYALWLVREERDPSLPSPPWRLLGVLAAAGALTAVLWFVPEYVGSGDLLRGASRALDPVEGSPATEAVPFLAVFSNSRVALALPVYVGALLALALAARARRDRTWPCADAVLAIGAITVAYMVLVAVLAQIGFTGNLRYVTLPAALAAVLCGVGWTQLVATVRRRRADAAAAAMAAVALAASVPFLATTVSARADQLRGVRDEARDAEALPAAIRRAGGARAILRCGGVYTGPFETQVVAWHLGVPSRRVGLDPRPPGTTLSPTDEAGRPAPRFRYRERSARWVVTSTCRPPA
jgi:hypothetical protein